MKLLKLSEVADRLSISTKTVRRLVDRRELDHVRVSRAVRVPEEAVAKYIDQNRVPAQ